MWDFTCRLVILDNNKFIPFLTCLLFDFLDT